jgi:hypothetical protein
MIFAKATNLSERQRNGVPAVPGWTVGRNRSSESRICEPRVACRLGSHAPFRCRSEACFALPIRGMFRPTRGMFARDHRLVPPVLTFAHSTVR